MDSQEEDELSTNSFFAFDLKTGKVAERPNVYDLGEYKVRYLPHERGNWATIGDGLRHEVWFQDYHWKRLLRIIKDDELDQSGLELILNGWLGNGFPDEASKKTFVSAVKSGTIKPVADYLPRSG